MATVTLSPVNDGFLNNNSGWYGAEDFIKVSSTSSSGRDQNTGYWKFTTVGSGIGALDIITSVTLTAYCTARDDANFVGAIIVYTDTASVWDNPTPWNDGGNAPNAPFGPGTGTVQSDLVGWPVLGSNSYNVATSIPTNGTFGVSLFASLSDIGPADALFRSREFGTNVASLTITYTPSTVASTPQRMLMGVGL